jgi:hypothetical protein
MIWPNIDMISRMNNLTQTIARAFSHQFSDFGRRVHTLAQELNEEQFWIKPYSYGNSFGNLVLHLTGNLNYYVGTQIAQTGYIRVYLRCAVHFHYHIGQKIYLVKELTSAR